MWTLGGSRHPDTNAFLLQLDERKEIDDVLKPMKERANLLQVEKTNLKEDMTLRKRIYNDMKKKLDGYEIKRGARESSAFTLFILQLNFEQPYFTRIIAFTRRKGC